MSRKIVNGLTAIGLIVVSLSLIYLFAIPQEVKEQVPFNTELTIALTGAFSAIMSSILIYVKTFIRKERTFNLDVNKKTLDSQLEFVNSQKIFNLDIENLIDKQNINVKELSKLIDRYIELGNENKTLLIELIKLNRTSLESTRTNPFIDKEVIKKIEGVLDEKEKQ